jgi:hypothetical protein
LKQAPWAWYSRFASYLLSIGFVEAKSDSSLFVFQHRSDIVYMLLYVDVDDVVVTASSTRLLRRIIEALQREFSMEDLGELHHFLGMQVQRSGDGMLLSAIVHGGYFGSCWHGRLQAVLYSGRYTSEDGS